MQFYACEMVLEEEGVFGGEWDRAACSHPPAPGAGWWRL